MIKLAFSELITLDIHDLIYKDKSSVSQVNLETVKYEEF
jgi:hypothetical protein